MKKNHDLVRKLILDAIRSCKEDYVLDGVKSHLRNALSAVDKVGDKRVSRDQQAKAFAEEAKKRNEKWMQMLKDGLKFNLPKVEDDETRID
jgi:hypothetical protein